MTREPDTMPAAYITACGPSEAIQIGRFPVPEPGPGEALVRGEWSAVNHVDTFIRSGAYRTDLPLPFIIGRDLVGTVVTTGPGTDGFETGDLVWSNSLGHEGRQGSFARYTIVSIDRLYHLPEHADPEESAAVLHTAAAAHFGLFREAKIRSGETLLLFGAEGGVGSAVVQLAAAAGVRVIAITSPSDARWCRNCGAEHVLDFNDSALMTRIAAAAGSGVDVLWDTTGIHDLENTVPLLANGGRVIAMAGLHGLPALPIGELYTRDASIHGFSLSGASTSDLAAAASTINKGLADGVLTPRVAAELPLSQAVEAHRRQEQGPSGRIVIDLHTYTQHSS